MNVRHHVTIAALLSTATAAGTVGLLRTLDLGPYHHPPRTNVDQIVASRSAELRQAEAALDAALSAPMPQVPRAAPPRHVSPVSIARSAGPQTIRRWVPISQSPPTRAAPVAPSVSSPAPTRQTSPRVEPRRTPARAPVAHPPTPPAPVAVRKHRVPPAAVAAAPPPAPTPQPVPTSPRRPPPTTATTAPPAEPTPQPAPTSPRRPGTVTAAPSAQPSETPAPRAPARPGAATDARRPAAWGGRRWRPVSENPAVRLTARAVTAFLAAGWLARSLRTVEPPPQAPSIPSDDSAAEPIAATPPAAAQAAGGPAPAAPEPAPIRSAPQPPPAPSTVGKARAHGPSLHRVYAAVGALLVFFVAWAIIAAHPWAGPQALPGPDPRLSQLAQREQRLRERIPRVRAVVNARFARYQASVAKRLGASTTAAARAPAKSRRSHGSPAVAVIWFGGRPQARTRAS